MLRKPNISNGPAELRRRAEAYLPAQRKGQRSKARHQKSAADVQRTLHELEVHQIELFCFVTIDFSHDFCVVVKK